MSSLQRMQFAKSLHLCSQRKPIPAQLQSTTFTFQPRKVIDDMASLGWGVVDAKQVKARKNQGYQKHMVVFGNDNSSGGW